MAISKPTAAQIALLGGAWQNHARYQGVVLHAMMYEGSGDTVHDLSSQGNDGAITDATWTAGQFGTSLAFNGTSAFVTFLNPDILEFVGGTDSFSLMGWIKSDGEDGTLISCAVGAENSRQWQLYLISNQVAGNVGGVKVDNVGDSINDNVWHHIALIATDSAYTLYVDGASKGAGSPGTAVDANIDILIGARRGTDNTDIGFPLDGWADDVRVYNRAISTTELASIISNPFLEFIVGSSSNNMLLGV